MTKHMKILILGLVFVLVNLAVIYAYNPSYVLSSSRFTYADVKACCEYGCSSCIAQHTDSYLVEMDGRYFRIDADSSDISVTEVEESDPDSMYGISGNVFFSHETTLSVAGGIIQVADSITPDTEDTAVDDTPQVSVESKVTLSEGFELPPVGSTTTVTTIGDNSETWSRLATVQAEIDRLASQGVTNFPPELIAERNLLRDSLPADKLWAEGSGLYSERWEAIAEEKAAEEQAAAEAEDKAKQDACTQHWCAATKTCEPSPQVCLEKTAALNDGSKTDTETETETEKDGDSEVEKDTTHASCTVDGLCPIGKFCRNGACWERDEAIADCIAKEEAGCAVTILTAIDKYETYATSAASKKAPGFCGMDDVAASAKEYCDKTMNCLRGGSTLKECDSAEGSGAFTAYTSSFMRDVWSNSVTLGWLKTLVGDRDFLWSASRNNYIEWVTDAAINQPWARVFLGREAFVSAACIAKTYLGEDSVFDYGGSGTGAYCPTGACVSMAPESIDLGDNDIPGYKRFIYKFPFSITTPVCSQSDQYACGNGDTCCKDHSWSFELKYSIDGNDNCAESFNMGEIPPLHFGNSVNYMGKSMVVLSSNLNITDFCLDFSKTKSSLRPSKYVIGYNNINGDVYKAKVVDTTTSNYYTVANIDEPWELFDGFSIGGSDDSSSDSSSSDESSEDSAGGMPPEISLPE